MCYEWIPINIHCESDGKLSCLDDTLPFVPRRIFWITDVPEFNIKRGEHAASNADFLYIILNGSVHMVLDDGDSFVNIILNSSNKALYVRCNTWVIMDEFEKDTMVLVVSDKTYRECHYVNDYVKFRSSLLNSEIGEIDDKNNHYWCK